MPSMRRLLLLSASFLAACAPDDLSGTQRAWMYLRSDTTQAYSLQVGEVANLESLRELRGRDIELRAATAIVEGLGTVDIDDGRPFAFDWSVDDDGVIVPADRDSFHALTLYRHFDRVASLLRDHGHVPARRLTVYYLPRYDNLLLGDGRLLFTDNAAYLSLARGFLIVPSFMLSELPMLLNEGVIAHEFGHAVVHQELFGDVDEEPNANSTDPEWIVARRHLIAMHEGVADLIGFAATGNPDYILATADVDRDLSEPRSLTAELALEMDTVPDVGGGLLSTDSFDPHEQGSIMARTVYEFWPKDAEGRIDAAERSRLLDVVLTSLRALTYEPQRFTLASFPDEVVRAMPASHREGACDVLRLRFEPLAHRLTACGAP